MRGLPTVAGHQALSAGTVLIAAGGLALYQMTSLVLGPAQARELPVSLTIPTVDADRLPETVGPGASHILGMAVAPTPSATPRRYAALAVSGASVRTVDRSMAVPATRPHVSMTMPLSSTRSRTSARP